MEDKFKEHLDKVREELEINYGLTRFYADASASALDNWLTKLDEYFDVWVHCKGSEKLRLLSKVGDREYQVLREKLLLEEYVQKELLSILSYMLQIPVGNITQSYASEIAVKETLGTLDPSDLKTFAKYCEIWQTLELLERHDDNKFHKLLVTNVKYRETPNTSFVLLNITSEIVQILNIPVIITL
jgi:hypothetical protein